MKKYFFNYGNIKIEYSLYRKKLKNINLRVKPDGEIAVSADKKVPISVIQSFVESKAEWVIKSVARIEKIKSLMPDNSFYSGKEAYILGKRFIIEIIPTKEEYIEITDKSVEIHTLKKDPEYARKLYKKWLRELAAFKFNESLERVYPRLCEMNAELKKPKIYIREMKSRWGSCNISDKKIGLNLRLVKARETDIDYVIIHELLHFTYPNHSDSFYGALSGFVPDWREKKADLENSFMDGI